MTVLVGTDPYHFLLFSVDSVCDPSQYDNLSRRMTHVILHDCLDVTCQSLGQKWYQLGSLAWQEGVVELLALELGAIDQNIVNTQGNVILLTLGAGLLHSCYLVWQAEDLHLDICALKAMHMLLQPEDNAKDEGHYASSKKPKADWSSLSTVGKALVQSYVPEDCAFSSDHILWDTGDITNLGPQLMELLSAGPSWSWFFFGLTKVYQ